jgi:hypothetical protein
VRGLWTGNTSSLALEGLRVGLGRDHAFWRLDCVVCERKDCFGWVCVRILDIVDSKLFSFSQRERMLTGQILRVVADYCSIVLIVHV